MNSQVFAHALALITVFVWGLTFISTKVLLVSFTPLQILFMRFVLGFVVLCVLSPHFLKLRDRKHELLFAAAGLTGTVIYYLSENIALMYADASFVSVAVSTAPLFTAILGFAVLKEKGFGPLFVLGFVLAIVGTAFTCVQGSAVSSTYATPLGVALCLAAAVSWAVYSLIVKKLSNLGYATIASTKRTFAWGLLFMAVILVFKNEPWDVGALAEVQNWGNLLFLGAMASAGCFVTWGLAVSRLGATMASAYIYLTPPITVVAGVIILGEPFTPLIGLGVALVLIGLVLSELPQRTTKQ